jgi:hypothetical protein
MKSMENGGMETPEASGIFFKLHNKPPFYDHRS